MFDDFEASEAAMDLALIEAFEAETGFDPSDLVALPCEACGEVLQAIDEDLPHFADAHDCPFAGLAMAA